jgi:GNAT superfamily N-acetyltransferase
MQIEIAITDDQIDACYPVMSELRPHLLRERFVLIVRDMMRDGYSLAFLADGGVVTVAGFRIKRTLFCDRFMYVDDLVTAAAARSQGYGRRMLEWLDARARAEGCARLDLDSGMQRKDAHRFYQTNDMPISGYHFSRQLDDRVPWAR